MHPEQEYMPIEIVDHSLRAVSFCKCRCGESHPLADSPDLFVCRIGRNAALLVVFNKASLGILTGHLLLDS